MTAGLVQAVRHTAQFHHACRPRTGTTAHLGPAAAPQPWPSPAHEPPPVPPKHFLVMGNAGRPRACCPGPPCIVSLFFRWLGAALGAPVLNPVHATFAGEGPASTAYPRAVGRFSVAALGDGTGLTAGDGAVCGPLVGCPGRDRAGVGATGYCGCGRGDSQAAEEEGCGHGSYRSTAKHGDFQVDIPVDALMGSEQWSYGTPNGDLMIIIR